MSVPQPNAGPQSASRLTGGMRAALACLAVTVLLQSTLVWQRAINWDEFWHMRLIYMMHDGNLTGPLQTITMRLFGWVTGLGLAQIDQLVTIRWAMFACEMATAGAIAAIAARFTSRVGGVLAAAAYVGGGFVFQHGFSFRPDALATALAMVSLAVLVRSRLRWPEALASGAMLGLATIVTIKTVLLAPCFAGVLWLRWCDAGRNPAWLARVAGLGAAAALTFALAYLAHAAGMNAAAAQTKGTLGASLAKMFVLGIPPYLEYAAKQLLSAPVLSLLVLLTPGLLARSSRPNPERIALAGLLAPLATLLFYHNTAPYYYAFMLAPVTAAAAIGIDDLRRRFGTAPLAAALALNTGLLWIAEPAGRLDSQRQVIAEIERSFGGPVAYFDFCGMLPAWPKANPFMTPWGIDLYHQAGRPAMREAMLARPVPLVLVNDPMFVRLFEGGEPTPEFLPADAAALRENYLPFWGPAWIAGKRIPARAKQASIAVLVPGTYTLRGASITIDGKQVGDGETIALQRGAHTVTSGSDREAALIWGDRIRLPSLPPPDVPIWTPF